MKGDQRNREKSFFFSLRKITSTIESLLCKYVAQILSIENSAEPVHADHAAEATGSACCMQQSKVTY